ncbi:MAG: hypothetical protein K2O88_00070 [Paramuribaculum sp.]|nr:hypothetical protein [Paramuribaculum sp.]
MKKFRITAIIAIFSSLLLTTGCNSSWKKTLCSKGDWEAMVRNCITDFIHTPLASTDSVFFIMSIDDNYRKLDCKSLLIGSESEKLFPYPTDTVGCTKTALPTKYIIVDNKLFLWDDKNKPATPITQELIDLLERYNRLDWAWFLEELEITREELTPDLDIKQLIPIPPYGGDELSKGAWYYIDKNDYTKYKRYIQSYDPFFEDRSEWPEYQQDKHQRDNSETKAQQPKYE